MRIYEKVDTRKITLIVLKLLTGLWFYFCEKIDQLNTSTLYIVNDNDSYSPLSNRDELQYQTWYKVIFKQEKCIKNKHFTDHNAQWNTKFAHQQNLILLTTQNENKGSDKLILVVSVIITFTATLIGDRYFKIHNVCFPTLASRYMFSQLSFHRLISNKWDYHIREIERSVI